MAFLITKQTFIYYLSLFSFTINIFQNIILQRKWNIPHSENKLLELSSSKLTANSKLCVTKSIDDKLKNNVEQKAQTRLALLILFQSPLSICYFLGNNLFKLWC